MTDKNLIKIIMLSKGDFAGSGFKIKQAVEKVSKKHKIITVVQKKHKYSYNSDYILDVDNKHYIQKLIDECDIIHFKGDDLPVKIWNGLIIPENKKVIITVGGSGFRRNQHKKPSKIALSWYPIEEYIERTDLRTCITPDLNYPNFKSFYTPHAIDVKNAPYTWAIKDKIIIQHSPSSRKKKGTNEIILPVLYELQDEGFNFEIELLENLSNEECVNRKKEGTIFIDQISQTGFYGMSTLESIQFGIPTIAYISEKSIEQSDNIINNKICKIISVKDKNELREKVKFLLSNKEYLTKLSIDTKKYAKKVHSFEFVGNLWINLYDKVLKNKKLNTKKNSNDWWVKNINSINFNKSMSTNNKKNYKIVFSLISKRENIDNLNHIVPNLLNQCDFLYINMINHNLLSKSSKKYSFLNNDKIILTSFKEDNFESYFSQYENHGKYSYYFLLDDNTKYPYNYSKVMIENMMKYDNEFILCNSGFNLNNQFYDMDNKTEGFEVSSPNIMNSCFYVGNFELNTKSLKEINLYNQYDYFHNNKEVKSVMLDKIRLWLKFYKK